MDVKQKVNIAENVVTYSFILFAFSCMASISLTQIAFAIGAAAWLYSVFLRNSWKEVQFPLGMVFSFFVLASILSILFSINPSKSIYLLKKLVQIGIFFMFLNNLKSTDQIKKLLTIIFLVAGLTGIFACYQSYEAGISLTTRVEGTMSVYITFATLMMVNSLMVLSFLCFDFHWRRDWWLLVVLVITLAGLALSLTRSAWVGIAIGISVLLFLKNRKLLLIAPVIVTVLLVFSPDKVRHRAESIFNPSNPTRVSRIDMWKIGINIFKDYPLTGIGFKNLRQVFDSYKVKANQKKVGGLHSNFFQIVIDTGIIGFTAWMLIWVLFFVKCRLIYKRFKSDPFFQAVIAGSVASVAAFLVTGFFEVNFYDSEVVMLIYFLMAIPFALSLMKTGFIPDYTWVKSQD